MATQAAAIGGREEIKVISLISVGHALSHFYMLVLPPLFPLIQKEFDVSWVAIGLFATFFGIATTVSQIPAGVLVDRIGARKVLIGGMFLFGLGFFLVAFTSQYWMILPLMVVAGLGNAAFHPADYAILSARVGKMNVGKAYSIHTFAGFVGWMIAPPMMLFLATQANWRVAVAVAGLLGIAMTAVMIWRGDLLDDIYADDEPAPAPAAGAKPQKSGLALMTSLPIMLLFTFFALNGLGGNGVQNFGVVAMMALHDATLELANFALTAYLVAGGIGVLFGGYLADRTTQHEILTVAFIALGAGFIAVVGLPELSMYTVIASIALGGFLLGAIGPSRDIMVRKASPRDSVGTAFGIVTTGFTVGGIVGPSLYGYMNDISHPEYVFLIGGAFQVLAIFTVLNVLNVRRRRAA